ncbi:perlucin-like [Mytilus trossulus]|uniref:perlucin-like n=1 Tax=Mytilus trossulus TaxID=6551 RepID=UPI0030076AA6
MAVNVLLPEVVLFVPVKLDIVENNVKSHHAIPHLVQMGEGAHQLEIVLFVPVQLDTLKTDVKIFCKNLGSMLAEVTSRSEIVFLRKNAKKYGENFWLGGLDRANEGVWLWTTRGQGFTVTDWHTRIAHQPNNQNGDEHCLNIYKRQDYEWNDGPCSRSLRCICEKPLVYF